ncbi:hypothetical protein [Sphingomonas sp. LHG3406-1]|uniref:hypothetical protein n=1 Tax=Sphingomonas sp. LHG3406-1 TaxID=2804617 RepID=UPI00260245F7|nr:hypothetical protein [Sphingomonas sp. LHG3406-1]
MKKMITTAAVLLFAATAHAQSVPVQDRIAELCTVSTTDLEGQRLARECRIKVRARYEAERTAARAQPQPLRTAANDAARPR